jgi:H+/Cl- antiporter ClcA
MALTPSPIPQPASGDMILSTLARPGAAPFWLAVLLTGIGTGVAAAALTRLLETVQHFIWNGPGTDLLEATEHAGAWRHILVLLGAGVVTGAGQIILSGLSSGNGIDTAAAIWFHAGRMPAWRTLGSALLSVVIAGMGVSLGREGAPKQACAVIAWADRNKPQGWRRLTAPLLGFGLLGSVSIKFPQLLGNGRDISQLAFTNKVGPAALLGAVLGHAWSWFWPGVDPGLFAVLGAAAVLAATTQGPISTVILMMELTGRDRSFIVPLLLAMATATLVARTIEPRSIYDARLTHEEVAARQKARELPPR